MSDASPQADRTKLDEALDHALGLSPGADQAYLRSVLADDAAKLRRAERLLALARSERVEAQLGALIGTAADRAVAALAPPAPLRVGTWRLGECLGSGGMAQVFRAIRDDGTVAQVAAVKILWPHQLRADYVSRFEREREILAALDDPRIARYLDGGVAADGRPWLAVELVEGKPLDRHAMRHDLDLDARLSLFAQIGAAVAAAHRQGVVHRDLKPANVLVRHDGDPRLLDFGIAALHRAGSEDALTREHGRLLTPEFASPEQLAGTRVDTRSDVYQLGAMLHLLLTGVHAAAATVAQDPAPPSTCVRERPDWPVPARALRGDLDAIVLKALDGDPVARYQSVDALLSDLQRSRAGLPIAARDHGPLRRGLKLLRRHWLASGAAACALLAVFGFALQSARHARAMAHEARVNRDAAQFIENVLQRAGPSQALSDEVLRSAAMRARVDLADQPALRARMLRMLARLHLGRVELQAAAGVAAEALAAAREEPGAEDWRESAVTLAEMRNYLGELAPAEALLREVIATPAPPAQAFAVLADVLHSGGRYGEALLQARAAVAAAAQSAPFQCTLGMVLRDRGQFDEARAVIGHAIDLETAVNGSGSIAIATCLEHLGMLEVQAGSIDAADTALQRAAQLRAMALGDGWSGMVWSHHWIALVHQARGDLAAAEPLLERAIENYRSRLGTRSQLLAYALGDLGWLRLAQARDGEAVALFDAAIDGLGALSHDSHPRLGESWLGLGIAAARAGDHARARALVQRAYDVRAVGLPPGHAARARACTVLREFGGSCTEAGDPRPDSLESMRLRMLAPLR